MTPLIKRLAVLFTLILSTALAPSLADDHESNDHETITDAMVNGKASLALRYRLELVDQDGFSDDAEASTLRARLNYRTGSYKRWSAFLEFDAVEEVGLDDFNSGAGTSGPDRAGFPVVADPEYAEVNQAYLDYDNAGVFRARLGRQRINLDNQRFVGGVGWRQNEQTYDGYGLLWQPTDELDIAYSYITNVNRIFGGDVAAGDHDHQTHLLNARWAINDRMTLTGYYYDIENRDVAGLSSDTLGLRLTGKAEPGEMTLSYTAEYASQSDTANNPVDYDADYIRLDGRLGLDRIDISLGYEVLEGDTSAGRGFTTSLATLHAFNGWADKFLATPAVGLEDLFIGVHGKLGSWKWQAIYHDFESESGSFDLGSELDFSLATKFNNRYGLLFKAADYNGDSGIADTTKLWLMLSATF